MWGREIISVTTPAAPGTIPAPYAYWSFEGSFADDLGGLVLADWAGFSGIGRVSGGLVGKGMAIISSSASSYSKQAAIIEGADMSLSVWFRSGAPPVGTYYAPGVGFANDAGLAGMVLPDLLLYGDQAWHHLYIAHPDEYYVDGQLAGSPPAVAGVIVGIRVQCGLANDVQDELAFFSDVAGAAHADIAAALYNGGVPTVYRDGQWWEVADV